MIAHAALGASAFSRARQLKLLIDQGEIIIGGNAKLKIYGKLNCQSGKRLKVANRVFFKDEAEAMALGYRPCGHCMPGAYQQWRDN